MPSCWAWWSGSDGAFWGLTETGSLGSLGSASELLQAGSKSDKVYDRHMKWLKDALLALAQKEPGNGVQSVFDYMGGTNGSYFDQRKGPEFTTPNGIIDSDSLSKYVKQIDSSALESDSWAMVGYKDKENGQLYYAVAIYSPDNYGGKTLAEQSVGTTVKTDLYRVNPTTGEIKRLENNRSMQVAENTKNGTKYHVLRDLK